MAKCTVDRLWKHSTPSTPEAQMTFNVDWSRLFSSALWIMSLGFIEWKFPGRFFLIDKTCFINMEHPYSDSRPAITRTSLGISNLETRQSIWLFFMTSQNKNKGKKMELLFVLLLLMNWLTLKVKVLSSRSNNFPIKLSERYSYKPNFQIKKLGSREREFTCPILHSYKVAEVGFKFRSTELQIALQ